MRMTGKMHQPKCIRVVIIRGIATVWGGIITTHTSCLLDHFHLIRCICALIGGPHICILGIIIGTIRIIMGIGTMALGMVGINDRYTKAGIKLLIFNVLGGKNENTLHYVISHINR